MSTIFPPIEQLLPHDPPMILLNHVLHYTDDEITCEVEISANSQFFDVRSQSVPAYVGIEYMAQTIAARGGMLAREQGRQSQIGFLLGGRRYQQHGGDFQLGDQLKVSAKELMQEQAMGVYACTIERNGELLASCQVNTYAPDQATVDGMLGAPSTE
ncbi:ApeP family dehydratase [Agarivorans sp. QJM3NY_33]|uniref:ApeP family dehydratase n=1 Tax=Agarivorans sp. QJM3NY_33 TaxID=3421432 RepID=UPI003D7DB1B7